MFLIALIVFFRYSVPDTPYYVPASVSIDQLSSLINSLLNEGNRSVSYDMYIKVVHFEFVTQVIVTKSCLNTAVV